MLDKMNEFQRRGVTIVLVSHSLGVVRGFCQRAIWLHGGAFMGEGTPSKVIRQYWEVVSEQAEMPV